ncbi:MAG: hypothetical protein [Bacteriophage sp.]|nr:MAG: hypothetical protein [Bacteriophage sp.]
MNGITKQDIDSLASDNITIANTIVILSKQGYIINSRKIDKLNLGTILLRMYRSVALGSKDYDNNIRNFNNKFVIL